MLSEREEAIFFLITWLPKDAWLLLFTLARLLVMVGALRLGFGLLGLVCLLAFNLPDLHWELHDPGSGSRILVQDWGRCSPPAALHQEPGGWKLQSARIWQAGQPVGLQGNGAHDCGPGDRLSP